MKHWLFVVALIFLGRQAFAQAPSGGPASATPNDHGLRALASQVQVSTQVLPSQVAATQIVAERARRCIKVKNTSDAFKVWIGSHSSVTSSNGYELDLSTKPASQVSLDAFRGTIYGFGQGSGTVKPTVAVLECDEP